MVDPEVELWRNIFSLTAGQKKFERKLAAALGEERIISLLGVERIFSALGDEKVVDVVLKNRRLLNLLLTKLDGKRPRKSPVRKAANGRHARRLNAA